MTNEPPADSPPAEDVEEAGSAAAGSATPPADAVSDGASGDVEPDQPSGAAKDKRAAVKDDGVAESNGGTPTTAATPEPVPQPGDGDANAELDALRNGLNELTRDLQRVTAEYANYRKRVDRDRTLVAEQATGAVLAQLLPVLDDLDRARNHGDLVGPFAAVAEQLSAALGKFGLTAFGDVGDPFDPQLHEAVAHTSSPDVTETACIEIMRRGYLLGDRLLRPALVAVADPE